MRKLSVFMLAALMGVFMVSCSNGDSPAAKAKEIFESVKDQLATMPKDELKAKTLEFGEVIKPIMTKSMEIAKKLMTDDNFTLDQVAEEYKKIGVDPSEVQDISKLVEDFTAEIQKNPAWNELQQDPEFGKKWMEAIGFADEAADEAEDTIGDAVEDAAEAVGDAVEGAAEDVANAVKEAVE